MPEDATFDVALTCLFDPRGQRFRIERQDQIMNVSRGSFFPNNNVWVHTPNDLRVHYTAVAPHRGQYYTDHQPDFGLLAGDKPVLTPTIAAPLLAYALIPASFLGGKSQLIVPLRTANFTIQPRVEHEGRAVSVLSFRGKKSASVRRYDQHGQLTGWTYAQFEFGNPDTNPQSIYTMTVNEFDSDPQFAAQDFVLEPTEGMVVSDKRERAIYILGSDGRRLPMPSLASENKGDFSWWMALVALGVLFAMGAAFWINRRWRAIEYG